MNLHRQKQEMRNQAAAGGCICLERWPGRRLMETCPPSFISANMRAHRSHSQPDWFGTRVYKSEYTQPGQSRISKFSNNQTLSNLWFCEYVNSVSLNMGLRWLRAVSLCPRGMAVIGLDWLFTPARGSSRCCSHLGWMWCRRGNTQNTAHTY